jgi:hypothetical protein
VAHASLATNQPPFAGRRWTLVLAGLALVAVLGLLGWRLVGSGSPPRPATGGTSVAARLAETDVIDIVAARPAPDGSGRSLHDALTGWSAEYRGDGSWLVRGGAATWVVFEQSRSVLPANRAAIDLASSGAAGRAR